MSKTDEWTTPTGIDCTQVLEVPKYERLAQGLALGSGIKEAAVDAGWKDCRSLHATIRTARRDHPQINLRVSFLLQHRSELKIFDFDGFCSDEMIVRGIKKIADAAEAEDSASEKAVSLNAWRLLADMKGMIVRKTHTKNETTVTKYNDSSDAELMAAASEFLELLPESERAKLVEQLADEPPSEIDITSRVLDS
jgi:hypothetical protein